ncbi:recombination regulator RecX [Macrococcus equipercicus]|uniref:Regulatory protein RecX n=1 Tax=Macrococcus equipercicus TaxID=69967 RepID=A0A9Q9BLI9_9STAP|nr:recombination regulator RecX [Macrococcus equipercicus]KAA1037673.1 recombination regulator RecX [Macrococcus equipercicus]UTH13385.1 recombination regulator RecX [Macrococcus equipercicus]
MKITMIEVQKNNKDRFNLYIDGNFHMGIDSATYVHFNLRKDDEVTKERLAEIKLYDDYRRAINRAIGYLSFKKRTEKEIRDYLLKDEVPEETVSQVLKYCYDNGYINHDDYARSLMNTMINTTDKGPDIFKQKLFEKGIERDLIDAYYEYYTEQMDEERMTGLIQKQLDKHARKSSKRLAEQKTIQTLVQKGYNLNIIIPYMKEISYNGDRDVMHNELEKQVAKWSRKASGNELKQKVITAMMRKGFSYDELLPALKESGIADE